MMETCECCNRHIDDVWINQSDKYEIQEKSSGTDPFVYGSCSCSNCITSSGNEVPKIFPKKGEARTPPTVSNSEGLSYPIEESRLEECKPCGFFKKVMENAKSILSMKGTVSNIVPSSNTIDEEPTKDIESCCTCCMSSRQEWTVSSSSKAVEFHSNIPTDSYEEESTIKIDATMDSFEESICSCDFKSSVCSPTCSCKSTISNSVLDKSKVSEQQQISKPYQCNVSCSCPNAPPSVYSKTVSTSKDYLANKNNQTFIQQSNISCECRIPSSASQIQQKSERAQICAKCNEHKDSPPSKDKIEQPVATNYVSNSVGACPKKPVMSPRLQNRNEVVPKVVKSVTTPNVTYTSVEKKELCLPNCSVAQRMSKSNVKKRDIRDEDNQVAFIGSPMLGVSAAVECFTVQPQPECNEMMCMLRSLASQEQEIKGQIKTLMEREKTYEQVLTNIQKTITQKSCPCCMSQDRGDPPNDIEKISQEMKMENKNLKRELMEMKLELKHCLEKVEGPMKMKLETETYRCEQLQQELCKASENMLANKDSHQREMNSLKMQLCMACSNLTELNSMNQKLKDEMKALDCMCNKLEDDLMKQKINEADTLKRLKKRPCCPCCHDAPSISKLVSQESAYTNRGFSKDSLRCDSNLHVIARKLSKTLRDTIPCEECAKLPPELASAAKCIKDLTDLVQSRKTDAQTVNDEFELKKDTCCQCLPPTETVCCQCVARRDIGAGESIPHTVGVQQKGGDDTETLYTVPPETFHVGAEDSAQLMKPSSYFSAQEESCATTCLERGCDPSAPCTGIPCSNMKLTGSAPAACGDQVYKQPLKEKEMQSEGTQKQVEEKEMQFERQETQVGEKGEEKETQIEEKEKEVEEKESQVEGKESQVEEKESQVEEKDMQVVEKERQLEDKEKQVAKQQESCDSTCLERGCGPLAPCGGIPCSNMKVPGFKPLTAPAASELEKPLEEKEMQLEETENQIREKGEGIDEKEQQVEEKGEQIEGKEKQIEETEKQVDGQDKEVEEKEVPVVGEKGEQIEEKEKQIEEEKEVPVVGEELQPEDKEKQVDEKGRQVVEVEEKKAPVVGEELQPEDKEKQVDKIGQQVVEGKQVKEKEAVQVENFDVSDPGKRADTMAIVKERPDVEAKASQETEAQTEGKVIVASGGAKPPDFEERRSGEFPFGVETRTEALDEPPDGFHVTTAVTTSGNLEVITEGGEGVIETTLNYTDDGTIEVVTQLIEGGDDNETPDGTATTEMDTTTKQDVSASSYTSDIETEKRISKDKRVPEEVGADVAARKQQLAASGTLAPETAKEASSEKILPKEAEPSVVGTDAKLAAISGVQDTATEEKVSKVKIRSGETEPAFAAKKGESAASDAQNAESDPEILNEKRFSDEAKAEFEAKKQKLAEQIKLKGSLVSGGSGLTDVESDTTTKEVPSTQDADALAEQDKTEIDQQTSEIPTDTKSIDKRSFNESAVATEKISVAEKGEGADASEKTDTTAETSSIRKMDVTTEQDVTESVQQTRGAVCGPCRAVGPDQVIEKGAICAAASAGLETTDVCGADVDASEGKKQEPTKADGAGEADATIGSDVEVSEAEADAEGMSDKNKETRLEKISEESEVLESSSAKGPSDTTTTTEPVEGAEVGAEESPEKRPSDASTTTEPVEGAEIGAESGPEKRLSDAASTTEAAEGDEMGAGSTTGPVEGAGMEAGSTTGAVEEAGMEAGSTTGAVEEAGLEAGSTTGAVEEAGMEAESVPEKRLSDAASTTEAVEGDEMGAESGPEKRPSDAASTAEPVDGAEMAAESGSQKRPSDVASTAESVEGAGIGTESSPEKRLSDAATTAEQGEGVEMKTGSSHEKRVSDAASSTEPVERMEAESGPDKRPSDATTATEPVEGTKQVAESRPESRPSDAATLTEPVAGAGTGPESGSEKRPSDAAATTTPTMGAAPAAATAAAEIEGSLKRQTADGSSHSAHQTERSCQCCECRNVGISTALDSATTTEKPKQDAEISATQGTIQGTEDSEPENTETFESAIELQQKETETTTEKGTDQAIAATVMVKSQGTTDEISIIPEESAEDKTSSGREESTKITDEKDVCTCDVPVEDRQREACVGSGESETSRRKSTSSCQQEIEKARRTSSSEVPDSVSKLSDKAVVPLKSDSSTDSKRPKRKRSSKLEDIQCRCPAPCQCVICSPDIMRKRIVVPGASPPPSFDKICCCNFPTDKTQKKAENKSHPLNCHCSVCECNPCSPCPPRKETSKTEAFLKSTNLGSNPKLDQRPTTVYTFQSKGEKTCRANQSLKTKCLAGPKKSYECRATCPKPSKCQSTCQTGPELYTHNLAYQRRSHPSNCECVDCLCYPLINQIAQMKEYPSMVDEKQVYQVKCVCPNAEKARKAMEARSRIPIATNSSNPPKVRSVLGCNCSNCICSPCADPNKSKPTGPAGPADLCEEKDKICCCKGPCDCQVCPVEELKKQVEDIKEKIAKITDRPSSLSERQIKVTNDADDEECDCVTCNCPNGPNKPQASGDDECDCEVCDCPNSPNKLATIDEQHPDDCDCPLCACPNAPKSAAPPSPPPRPVCDCVPCDCSRCGDPTKSKPEPKVKGPGGEAPPSGGQDLPLSIRNICDCDPCECTPCREPTKQPGYQPPADNIENCVCSVCNCLEEGTQTDNESPDAARPLGCTCAECSCPGGPSTAETAIGFRENAATHPQDCKCDECKCAEAASAPPTEPTEPPATEKETHQANCTCKTCECPGANVPTEPPATETETHPTDCICKICICSGTSAPPASEHPTGCKCAECKCVDCFAKTQPATQAIDCKCPQCVCTDCQGAEKGCRCDDCKCTDCFYAQASSTRESSLCKCNPCNCVECSKAHPKKAETDETSQAKKTETDEKSQDNKAVEVVPPAPLTNRSCHCLGCQCDVCAEGVERKPPEEPASGDKEVIAKTSVMNRSCHCIDCCCQVCSGAKEGAAAPAKEKICHCLSCVCIDCTGKKQAAGDDKSPDCKCPTCTCISCSAGAPGATEISCHCTDCQCPDCKAKSAVKEQKSQGEGGGTDKSPNCKCPTCTCIGCSAGAPGATEISCHCSDCQCIDCKAKSAGKGEEGGAVPPCNCADCKCAGPKPGLPQSQAQEGVKSPNCKCPQCACIDCSSGEKDGAVASKVETCHCADCKCEDCKLKDTEPTNKALKDAAPKGGLQFTDPPPFEVPTRQPCECDTCDCAICSKKERKKIEFKPEEPPCLDDIPPFEIPERIQCTCASCSCAYCNKEGSRAADRDVQTQITGSPQSTPAFPSASPPEPSERPVSAPIGSAGRDQLHCECPTCTCAGAPEKTVSINNCSCSTCKCNEEIISLLYGRGSFVSNNTSAGDNKSEKHTGAEILTTPSKPCTCPICACADISTGQVAAGNAGQAADPEAGQDTSKPCICSICACGDVSTGQVAVQEARQGAGKDASQNAAKDAGTDAGQAKNQESTHPKGCNCAVCACPGITNEKIAKDEVGTMPSKVIKTESCSCSVCMCADANIGTKASAIVDANVGTKFSAADANIGTTVIENAQTSAKQNISNQTKANLGDGEFGTAHDVECICSDCCRCPAKLQMANNVVSKELDVVDISKLDNESLIQKIEANKRENCRCREQIKEIKRALNKIQCACNEAEQKAPRTEKAKMLTDSEIKNMKNKPLVKQASAFDQTMSGLKLALHNLQSKCKAKDRMINAMTGELKTRVSSHTLDKAFDTTSEAPDYDRAEDVKSVNCSQGEPASTFDFESKVSRAMAAEKQKTSRSKSSKSCKCGKAQHRDKENLNVNLSGFEVVDIRRITQDSIIIKWKAPKTNVVTGYDIFVNGVNKSKVMSGGRTSAMLHSLDLSATIQITIYAVTKSGRCEPPAIAIYEIQ